MYKDSSEELNNKYTKSELETQFCLDIFQNTSKLKNILTKYINEKFSSITPNSTNNSNNITYNNFFINIEKLVEDL